MKKTISAVKYITDCLNISPDELFKQIESSQNYDGDSELRWYASKVIGIAEKEGIPFSKLLVKKFDIKLALHEENTKNKGYNEDCLNRLVDLMPENLYTVGFEDNLGKPLNDVDWFKGLDLTVDNLLFIDNQLPEEIRIDLVKDNEIGFLINMMQKGSTNSELANEAKNAGINIKTRGHLFLYRFSLMVQALESENIKIGLVCPSDMIYSEEYIDVWDEFLSYFELVDGYYLNDTSLREICYMVFKIRSSDSNFGIHLKSSSGDKEKIFIPDNEPYFDKIKKASTITGNEPRIDCSYNIVQEGELPQGVLGYLNLLSNKFYISTLPFDGSDYIPITKENIKDIIILFSLSLANADCWGYNPDMSELVTAKPGYEDILYSSIPLFLFSNQSKIEDVGEYKSQLNHNNETVKELVEEGYGYFSFEAKELYTHCMDFLGFIKEYKGIDNVTFAKARELAETPDIAEIYEKNLIKLRESLSALSQEYVL